MGIDVIFTGHLQRHHAEVDGLKSVTFLGHLQRHHVQLCVHEGMTFTGHLQPHHHSPHDAIKFCL